MRIGLLKAKDMMEAAFPDLVNPDGTRFVIFADNDSGVPAINVTANATGTVLPVTWPAPADTVNRKRYKTGTRVTFTSVAFTSTPQVEVGRLYHVVAATDTNITLSEEPWENGGTPVLITYTGAGAATIRDLNVVETLGTDPSSDTSQVYSVIDAARYEVPLGVDRPEWAPKAIALTVANSLTGDTSLDQRASMSLARLGTVNPTSDVNFTAMILIESPAVGSPAIATPFGTNGVVSTAGTVTNGLLIGGEDNFIRAEISML